MSHDLQVSVEICKEELSYLKLGTQTLCNSHAQPTSVLCFEKVLYNTIKWLIIYRKSIISLILKSYDLPVI